MHEVSFQHSWGFEGAVRPLVGSRDKSPGRAIGEALQTVAILKYLRPKKF